MPRRRLPPHLYHDQTRGDWVIRDGAAFVRTGVAYGEFAAAERALADYIADKYKPAPSPVPSMADVLLAYRRDKVPSMKSRAAIYNVRNLAEWWGDKTLADVTAANCRAFTATRTQAAARADLDKLAAAINHWHAEYGPLQVVPKVWKPPKPAPRERWLTRSEAAKFLWQCRRTEHLKRFVLIGLYTGSRAGVLRELQWSWIDLELGPEVLKQVHAGVVRIARDKGVTAGRRMRVDTTVVETDIHHPTDRSTGGRGSGADAHHAARSPRWRARLEPNCTIGPGV